MVLPSMSAEKIKGFDFSISSGQDTLITGHGGGGGSQAPAYIVVTVKDPSAFPPLPSDTVTRTSCGPGLTSRRSQSTKPPVPEMVPSVVEYSYRKPSASGSVAFTTNSTSGLGSAGVSHGQIAILVNDEVNESIAGGRLRCRRGFCSEADSPATSGDTRANEIINSRFTMTN